MEKMKTEKQIRIEIKDVENSIDWRVKQGFNDNELLQMRLIALRWVLGEFN
jgi:hypothetical protein